MYIVISDKYITNIHQIRNVFLHFPNSFPRLLENMIIVIALNAV